jgi:hypothetical protein
VIGLEVDPDDDAFEAALAAQRDARRTRFLATLQRLRDAGSAMRSSKGWTCRATTRSVRPTVARALIAAGHATSVDDASGNPATDAGGRRTRQGLGPVDAIGDPRRGRAGIAGPLPGGARPAVAPSIAGRRGPERPRDPPFVVSRGHAGGGVRGRGDPGPVGTGGTDYHGDYGPYAGATPRSCSRTRLRTASGPRSVADARALPWATA